MPGRRRFGRIVIVFGVLCVLCLVLAGVLLVRMTGGRQTADDEAATATRQDGLFEAVEEMQEAEVPAETDPADEPGEAEASGAVQEEEPDVMTQEEQQIRARMAEMTLEEKAAQLFFVTPESITGVESVTRCGDTLRSALNTYPVGGLIFFAQNLQSEEQTKALLSGVRETVEANGGIPLFLGIDEEGGKVARIGNNAAFNVPAVGSMRSVAASGDAANAYDAGATVGSYLHAYGFNLDFAPDADVLTNASNSVIGDRSFSSSPEIVAAMAEAYAGGLMDNAVIPVYKHFPGHGGTVEDSHKDYAYLSESKEELYAAELIPFIDAAQKGVPCIMAGHISVPQITGDDTPATLSQELITGILREEIGFEGVIITDAMAMGAVSEHYASGSAAVYAITAGCDMILMPADFRSALSAVVNAVEDGTISEERLDASVYRILALKQAWL